MDKEQILGIVGVIIVIVLVALRVYKVSKEDKPLEKLTEFLKSATIIDDITDIILKEISTTDFSTYDTVLDAEKAILKNVYDESWTYLKESIWEQFGDDKLYAFISNLLTIDVVQEEVMTIAAKSTVQKVLTDEFQKQIDLDLEDTLREEQERIEEADKFNNGEYTPGSDDEPVPDLDPTRINGVAEVDENLNPPTDEGAPMDEGVDVVEEVTLDINTVLENTEVSGGYYEEPDHYLEEE